MVLEVTWERNSSFKKESNSKALCELFSVLYMASPEDGEKEQPVRSIRDNKKGRNRFKMIVFLLGVISTSYVNGKEIIRAA